VDAVKQEAELWPDPTVVFMGSGYGPNLEAAHFICSDIAPKLPWVTFAICGSVANLIAPHRVPPNVKLAGVLSEAGKRQMMAVSRAAVNPMFSGSGTNIKMFDFMAASLPVISTPIGARGIERTDEALIVCQPSEICDHLERILKDEDAGKSLGLKARALVEDLYSWEKISPLLGSALRDALFAKLAAGNGHRLPDPEPMGSTGESPSAAADPKNPLSEGALPSGPLAILTTWDVRCGIAEYSRRLTEELTGLGVSCAVMANGLAQGQDSPATAGVECCWDYQALSPDKILSFLESEGIRNVSVQYHNTFFPESALTELVGKLTQRGIRVNVTLHNFLDPSQSTLADLEEAGAGLVVHSQEGVEHLKRKGINTPFRLDMSVPRWSFEPTASVRDRLGRREPLLLGTCGFLRPHKGMLELIDAMVWLRDLVGEVGLIAMTPLHPARDSQEYLVKCVERIRHRGLEDVVSLNTDFVSEGEIIQNLHACDVLVLPYHESSEGSSAAARTALAALRPLITSRSRIFDDLAPVVHRMESLHPASIALANASALTNPVLARSLHSKVRSYASEHSPVSTARRFAEIFREPAAS
jgi:glycosyltransferase involved in cell wall biosynthesis